MNYIIPVYNAINIIEQYIYEGITVTEIAKKVGYSQPHFSRIFRSLVGESLQSYIYRRKLSMASNDLLGTDKKAIEIAFQYNYSSYEAFSRSFKSFYGTSPFFYRLQGTANYLTEKKRISLSFLEHLQTCIQLNPQIVYLDDKIVSGIHVKTTTKKNTLPEQWHEFNNQTQRYLNAKESVLNTFSICETNSPNYDNTGNITFKRMLAFENYTNNFILKKQFDVKLLPGGKYAMFIHCGPIKDIDKSYEFIWNTWLQTSKEQLDLKRYDFELYGENFLGENNQYSVIYIYVPLVEHLK